MYQDKKHCSKLTIFTLCIYNERYIIIKYQSTHTHIFKWLQEHCGVVY